MEPLAVLVFSASNRVRAANLGEAALRSREYPPRGSVLYSGRDTPSSHSSNVHGPTESYAAVTDSARTSLQLDELPYF